MTLYLPPMSCVYSYHFVAFITRTCLQTTTWNDSLLQLKSTQRGNLIASVGTGILSLWRPTHGQFLHPLRCPSHPYHCLEVVGEQMVSVSSNGYLTIHDRFETNVSYTPITMITLCVCVCVFAGSDHFCLWHVWWVVLLVPALGTQCYCEFLA